MSSIPALEPFVRTEEAPRLPAPPATVGIVGWLRTNLFSSAFHSILTILFGALIVWLVWSIVEFTLVNAVWAGINRDDCLVPADRPDSVIGACWPLVSEKFPQWIYGFFPIDQRWRVNICFVIGLAALAPMLIPKAPHKFWNALFLLTAFPLITIILLTGGNLEFKWSTYGAVVFLMLLAANSLPMAVAGIEAGIERNKGGLAMTGGGLLIWLVAKIMGYFGVDLPWAASTIPFVLAAVGAAWSIFNAISSDGKPAISAVISWVTILVGIIAIMLLLDTDFGLSPVETSQWGGLTVTLVVSVTGIVFSLPLGILLALGRRSTMPIVQMFSVMFIELWRGVPLITVLFMSSNMLPLFLPEGVNFDKLLRCLIGVALFSAAYMAEVVRSGLQAIPRGQYEGAMALGLSYWQTMNKIILPQALKIAIPNIVGNFISLFKDTTLVSIIGLFDLLGIVQAGLRDANWATPVTAATGYLTVAVMFWVFCFGMSRYSIYTERRLHTGHRR
jgi:general L-amino acid transport system permease protein